MQQQWPALHLLSHPRSHIEICRHQADLHCHMPKNPDQYSPSGTAEAEYIYPLISRIAVINRSWEFHERKDAVIYRNHDTRHLCTKRAAQMILSIEVATEPSASRSKYDEW